MWRIAAGVLLIGFVRCAYFNTFYNAKMAFNTAHKAHRKDMRQHPDSTIEPTGRVLSNYNSAIEKSEKVIDVYPKSTKWHDDAIFLIAKSNFYKGEMRRAIRSLRRLQKEFPGSPFVPESYLLLGRAYLRNENYQKAEETFSLVLEKYPQLNKNEEVSLLLAKLAVRREGKALAIELLERIRNSIKSDDKKVELILQISELYRSLNQYDKAVSTLKSAPRKKDLPHQMYRVDFLLLRCYLEQDSLHRALSLARTMEKKGAYAANLSDILLKKAEVLARLGKTEQALAIYQKIVARYDSTAAAGEAWYRQAVLYQKDKGNFDRAKACYDSALAYLADSAMADTARQRSEAIVLVDTLRGRVLEPDTADTAESVDIQRYKIGELFWLELNEPDSAYRRFVALARDSGTPPETHPKALYAAGWLSLNARRDTAAADSIFDLLVEKYPENIHSKRAQRDLGNEITVTTPEDRALEAFSEAEELYVENDSTLEAVRSYLKVYKENSDREVAPKSLYAAAWICDNVLHKNRTARSLYQRLCDDYPESEYCLEAAKPRLKIALDTLAAMKERRKRAERLSEPKTRAAGTENDGKESEHANGSAADSTRR
jgi:TolA-binding protein